MSPESYPAFYPDAAVGWPHLGSIGWDVPSQQVGLPPHPQIAGPSSQRLDSVSQQIGDPIQGEDEDKPLTNGHNYGDGSSVDPFPFSSPP